MNITIVGLGVIGGSFAMAFKEAGFEDVYAVDLNKESIEKAKNMGIIKDGSDNAKQFLEIADLVIICIYPVFANLMFFFQLLLITNDQCFLFQ